ncbi:hypothetical protein JCM6882_008472 [Rhodosporidiobolus microsporus]
MPLNYNKWDNLQLSDDSDIEVHPNVDKKSMIRWKQRDIHEKRAIAKQKLANFPQEEKMNRSLLGRMDALLSSTKSQGQAFLANEILRLKASLPYKYEEKTFTGKAGEEQPSEDHMIINLLMQVVAGVQKKEEEAGKGPVADRTDALVKELEWHRQRLVDRQEEIKKETVEIEKEQAKYITSDDLKMGWDSKTIVSSTPTAQPKTATPALSSSKPARKTETVIETLNSPGVQAAEAKVAAEASEGDSSDEADVPPLTPSALAFSRIPPLDWSTTRQAISSDPSLLTEETGDALMVEAFSQGMKGTKEGDRRARECIEKALVGQYCRSLGRDGVMLFFQRMTNQNPAALKVFMEDVAKTSDRVIDRARVVASERASKAADSAAEGIEQIQLVASDPSTVISFEVPDGPPPEQLEITGEGADELDPVLVREFLQKRWDIFESFPKNLKKALEEKSLEKVNKVLGKMAVEEAEEVVEKLQEAGILSFETPGVIDQTGRSAPSNETVTVPVPSKDSSAAAAPPSQEPKIVLPPLEDDLD